MRKMRRKITQKDVDRAREVTRRFSDLPLDYMSNEDKRNLIRVFYNNIHGVPIEKIPENQLHRIAESVRRRAYKIASEYDSAERAILENIEKMIRAKGEEKEFLEERVCIQLEGCNIPLNSYVSKKYEEAR